MNYKLPPVSKPEVKPPAGERFLFASVMAVLWVMVTYAFWVLLAIGFGESRGNVRLLTMLGIGAVVVVFLCGHAYGQGWKSKRERGGRS